MSARAAPAQTTELARPPKPRWRQYGEPVLVAVLVALAVRVFIAESFRVPSAAMAPTLLAGDHVLVSKLSYGLRVPFAGWRLFGRAGPRRGDVIVFESPRDPSVAVVKRVVGVPGDVVELREQVLHVNGVPQPRTPEGEASYEDRGDGDGDGSPLEPCRRFREALAKGPLATPDGGGAAAIEASWQAGASEGVASYEVLQCRRPRVAAREGPYGVIAPGHVFVLGDNRDRSADSRGAGGWQVPLRRVKGRATLVFFSWGKGGAWPLTAAGPRLDRLFKPVE